MYMYIDVFTIKWVKLLIKQAISEQARTKS